MRVYHLDTRDAGAAGPRTAMGGAAHAGTWSDSPGAASDPELLDGCRAGDQNAWEILVGRYERLVFSVALRNGLTRDEAADITQATFVALLESITRLRDEERLASWLMTVARRLAWRQRQRNERERPYWEGVTWPENPIEAWERAAAVQEALVKLGAPCRDLLQALYFDPDEPSYAEIAARLGRRVGGIGPMRARCLQQMRTLLGEDAEE